MKNIKPQVIASFLLLSVLIIPSFIFAAPFPTFVSCGADDPYTCGFGDLVTLFNNVINGLVMLATLVTAGVLAYAGFRLMTAQGSESEATKTKEMFFKTIKGYLWILVAWTLVYTIMNTLLDPTKYTQIIK